jgi:hypothetical protein
MASATSIEIHGIKQALKEIQKMDKSLRRQITKDYKQIVSSVIADAHSNIPSTAPLSGMQRPWKSRSGAMLIPMGGWDSSVAKKMLKAKINTRKVKEFRGNKVNVGVFGITWTGAANTIFDISGKRSGGNFVNQLNARYGRSSRIMWPSYEKNALRVEQEMVQLVERIMAEVGRNISTMRPSS